MCCCEDRRLTLQASELLKPVFLRMHVTCTLKMFPVLPAINAPVYRDNAVTAVV